MIELNWQILLPVEWAIILIRQNRNTNFGYLIIILSVSA